MTARGTACHAVLCVCFERTRHCFSVHMCVCVRACACVCVCLQTDKAKALLAFLENKFFEGNIQQTGDKEKVGCIHSSHVVPHLSHLVLSVSVFGVTCSFTPAKWQQ